MCTTNRSKESGTDHERCAADRESSSTAGTWPAVTGSGGNVARWCWEGTRREGPALFPADGAMYSTSVESTMRQERSSAAKIKSPPSHPLIAFSITGTSLSDRGPLRRSSWRVPFSEVENVPCIDDGAKGSARVPFADGMATLRSIASAGNAARSGRAWRGTAGCKSPFLGFTA